MTLEYHVIALEDSDFLTVHPLLEKTSKTWLDTKRQKPCWFGLSLLGFRLRLADKIGIKGIDILHLNYNYTHNQLFSNIITLCLFVFAKS